MTDMFKVGEDIVCVYSHGSNTLTVGNVYNVVAITGEYDKYVLLKNDVGYEIDYSPNRFLSLPKFYSIGRSLGF